MHDNGLLVEDAAFLVQFLDGDMYAPKGERPEMHASELGGANQVATLPASQPVMQPATQIVALSAQPQVQSIPKLVSQPAVNKPIAQPVIIPVQQQQSIPYWGQNAERILVLVQEPEHEFLAQADLDLLLKILVSIKRAEADIALVNLGRVGMIAWGALNKQFAPLQVITFGMPKSGYPSLALSQRYVVTALNGYKTLHADPLSTMQGNDTLKRALWNALKAM